MGALIFDAGVVLGALNPDDTHHVQAAAALRDAVTDGTELIIPATAYAETLVHPFRQGADAVTRVDAFLQTMGAKVAPVTAELGRIAAQLRATHPAIWLPDAVVLAAGLQADATILTTDGRWPTIASITVEVLTSSSHRAESCQDRVSLVCLVILDLPGGGREYPDRLFTFAD